MAVRGTFRLSNPTNVDMTLTITMSAKEWKVIKSRLIPGDTNGDWYLDATISDLLDKANKEFHFYDEVTTPVND